MQPRKPPQPTPFIKPSAKPLVPEVSLIFDDGQQGNKSGYSPLNTGSARRSSPRQAAIDTRLPNINKHARQEDQNQRYEPTNTANQELEGGTRGAPAYPAQPSNDAETYQSWRQKNKLFWDNDRTNKPPPVSLKKSATVAHTRAKNDPNQIRTGQSSGPENKHDTDRPVFYNTQPSMSEDSLSDSPDDESNCETSRDFDTGYSQVSMEDYAVTADKYMPFVENSLKGLYSRQVHEKRNGPRLISDQGGCHAGERNAPHSLPVNGQTTDSRENTSLNHCLPLKNLTENRNHIENLAVDAASHQEQRRLPKQQSTPGHGYSMPGSGLQQHYQQQQHYPHQHLKHSTKEYEASNDWEAGRQNSQPLPRKSPPQRPIINNTLEGLPTHQYYQPAQIRTNERNKPLPSLQKPFISQSHEKLEIIRTANDVYESNSRQQPQSYHPERYSRTNDNQEMGILGPSSQDPSLRPQQSLTNRAKVNSENVSLVKRPATNHVTNGEQRFVNSPPQNSEHQRMFESRRRIKSPSSREQGYVPAPETMTHMDHTLPPAVSRIHSGYNEYHDITKYTKSGHPVTPFSDEVFERGNDARYQQPTCRPSNGNTDICVCVEYNHSRSNTNTKRHVNRFETHNAFEKLGSFVPDKEYPPQPNFRDRFAECNPMRDVVPRNRGDLCDCDHARRDCVGTSAISSLHEIIQLQSRQLQALQSQVGELVALQGTRAAGDCTTCGNNTTPGAPFLRLVNVGTQTYPEGQSVSVGVNTSFTETQAQGALTREDEPEGHGSEARGVAVDGNLRYRPQQCSHNPAAPCQQCHHHQRRAQVNESLTLQGTDLPTVPELDPSPVGSIHVDMAEYRDSSDDDADTADHSERHDGQCANNLQENVVGWTFYNNVVGQVNKLLECSAPQERPPQGSSEGPATPESVRQATMEQLRRMGISLYEQEGAEQGQVSAKSKIHTSGCSVSYAQAVGEMGNRVTFDSVFYPRVGVMAVNTESGESDSSLRINALALKYLKDEQLSEFARLSAGTEAPDRLKDVTVYNLATQTTNLSFATMGYLKRYHLLPGTGAPIKGPVIGYYLCSGPVLRTRSSVLSVFRTRSSLLYVFKTRTSVLFVFRTCSNALSVFRDLF
uniref:Uncharacterized protein n=1 Tax=Timema poppense TaxID=170557 RepID=A0A7R9D4I4_TIMPO|nr:unnamed protein product [Timema poppensis]